MIKATDFDSESKTGKIVLKTSKLYNALSDAGYDVEVSFDNGESQSNILLGQQGGKVSITITDADKSLKAYTSGNFGIESDNIKILNDIQNIISKI